MSIYVISDIGFNTKETIRHIGEILMSEVTINDCKRYITQRWNESVTKEDIVVVYGEFFAEDTKRAEVVDFINNLNGKIVLADSSLNHLDKKALGTCGFAAVYDLVNHKPINLYCTIDGERINMPGSYEVEEHNFVTAAKQEKIYKVNLLKKLDISLAANHWDYSPIAVSEINDIVKGFIDEVNAE